MKDSMKLVLITFILSLIIAMNGIAFAEDELLLPVTNLIDEQAFAYTAAVETIVIPEGVERIEKQAFAYSGVKYVYFPDSLMWMASDVFEGCELQNVYCVEGSYAQSYCEENEIPFSVLRPIELKSMSAICPWGAGGGTDACLRAFCMTLGNQLDVTVTVDNKTGTGGVIGHEYLSDADPDGRTIGMITFELSGYKHQEMSDLTYADYDLLCRISTDTAAVTVNTQWAAANGITDLASFIRYCKAHPGEVMMGGASAGSVWHIAGGYLMNETGIDLRMVNYATGTSDAVKAAAQGEIQGVTVSLAEARSFIGYGLTVLGVMDAVRNPAFPDAPTCKEQGYDLEFGSWRGLALPKGVDRRIRSMLEQACAAAIEQESFINFMSDNGMAIAYLDSEAFKDFLKENYKTVGEAIQKISGGPLQGEEPDDPEIEVPEDSLIAVCPWGAGGGSDATLRMFGQAMEKVSSIETVMIDNVTGAGGVIGHEYLSDADPDGRTIGMITFELSGYKHQGMSDLTYADYDLLCRISTDTAAVTVNTQWAAANGITDLASFIRYCKAHPGEVMMGGASAGSVWHIAGGYLMNETGIDLRMVNYATGTSDAVKAAAQGEIQGVTVSLAEARSFIGYGLTVLGVMDAVRNPAFPDAPTCKEQGYDLEFGSWRGLALPKGVDEEVRENLEQICAAAIEYEAFEAFMNNSGITIAYLDSEAFEMFLKRNYEETESALRAAHLI